MLGQDLLDNQAIIMAFLKNLLENSVSARGRPRARLSFRGKKMGQASLSDIEEHILVYEKSQINFCGMCTRSHQKACQ